VPDVLCPVIVGREEELRALDLALSTALAGSGGLVFVTGEAGIGKSRLVRELLDHARRQDAGFVTGRAVPAGGDTPYRPLTEALLQALRDQSLPEDPELAAWVSRLGAILPTIASRTVGETSPPVLGERCCTFCGGWRSRAGWWWFSKTCTGRTPTRCRCSNISATTSPSNGCCAWRPFGANRHRRRWSWSGGSGADPARSIWP
jgi:hypothetical protein